MQNAIGVFDSGLGGLSVLNSALSLLPNEEFIYVADSLHAPFGNKSDDFILTRCQVICQFLIKKQVKCILLACNTATLACVAKLREQFDVPIVAIEPGLKPAVLQSNTRKILMLATSSTLVSGNYQKLRHLYARDCEIFERACEGWVELVEAGYALTDLSHAHLKVIEQYLTDIHEHDIDQIVLGCTHYPFLKPFIFNYLKHSNNDQTIHIVDTSYAVANHLKATLIKYDLLNLVSETCSVALYSSAWQVDQFLLNQLCTQSIQFKGRFEE